MNRMILKPLQLRKRFIAALAALFAIFILAGLFAACGNDDNVTGGNGNPPPSGDSLIWSLDTLSIWSSNPHVKHFTLTDTTTKINKFKLLLNLTSNADSCCGNDSNFVSFISTVYPFINNWYAFDRSYLQANPVNINITFTLDNFTDFKHDLYFGFSHQSPIYPAKYIKLNNFKLYAVR